MTPGCSCGPTTRQCRHHAVGLAGVPRRRTGTGTNDAIASDVARPVGRSPDNCARSQRRAAVVRLRTCVHVKMGAVERPGRTVRPWAPTGRRACSSQSRTFGAGGLSRGPSNARVREDALARFGRGPQDSVRQDRRRLHAHARSECRGGRIRTGGPLLPKQVRYQTALHPVGALIACAIRAGPSVDDVADPSYASGAAR